MRAVVACVSGADGIDQRGLGGSADVAGRVHRRDAVAVIGSCPAPVAVRVGARRRRPEQGTVAEDVADR